MKNASKNGVEQREPATTINGSGGPKSPSRSESKKPETVITEI